MRAQEHHAVCEATKGCLRRTRCSLWLHQSFRPRPAQNMRTHFNTQSMSRSLQPDTRSPVTLLNQEASLWSVYAIEGGGNCQGRTCVLARHRARCQHPAGLTGCAAFIPTAAGPKAAHNTTPSCAKPNVAQHVDGRTSIDPRSWFSQEPAMKRNVCEARASHCCCAPYIACTAHEPESAVATLLVVVVSSSTLR